MSDKYIYSAWGDGTTTWIYRISEDGQIVRGKSTDEYYSYFDLAELPKRIACEFRDHAKRKWSLEDYPEQETLVSEVPENSEDTGITSEEFKKFVISHYDNVIFEKCRFKMLVEMQDRTKKYVNMPTSLLESIAKKVHYFGSI